MKFNKNPEDNKDLVDFDESTDNEMSDQGVYNKTTNLERFIIDNISKTGTSSKLILKLSMKKHNHRKLPF